MFEVALSGQMFDNQTIWDHLSAAADLGYRGVELRSTHINPKTDEETLKTVQEFLEAHNLEVNCMSCFCGNYGLLDDVACETAYGVFEQYLQLAKRFHARMIRVWPAWVESVAADEAVYERAAQYLKRSADAAAAIGCRIAMEMHHGTILDTAESSLKLLQLIDKPNVGLILDPVNLYQVPVSDVVTCIHKLGGAIYDVHIKDIIKLASCEHPGCFRYDFYAKHIGRFTPVMPPKTQREDYYAHRRIGMGGVDWPAVLHALKDIGYQGMLAVESVSESDAYMPAGRALALACIEDVRALQNQRQHLPDWHAVSPEVHGLHWVISPDRSPCKSAHMLRLNLNAGETFQLKSEKLEMNPLLIQGSADIDGCGLHEHMEKLDSFYMPGNQQMVITAGTEGASFYIGAAVCEGIGKPFFRKCDRTLPFGEIHQIHGEGSGMREVFFTLNEECPASRLICGITWGADGMWTSWPPHQHEKQLEEVYCYFDMPSPHTGLHLSYGTDEAFVNARYHNVSSGHMVLAPNGYHPTVATPGTRNVYFWVLAAFGPDTRGYGHAVSDPFFASK